MTEETLVKYEQEIQALTPRQIIQALKQAAQDIQSGPEPMEARDRFDALYHELYIRSPRAWTGFKMEVML
jgi:hypothetical protein